MKKITVQRAAALLGKSTLFVRESIKRGTLPIGTAEKMPGSSRWTFIISPQALADYMGCSVSELYDERTACGKASGFTDEQISRLWRAFLRALSEEGARSDV